MFDKLRSVSAFVRKLPWKHLRDAYEHLRTGGMSSEDAAAAVAALVDELMDWRTLVPGPAGATIERVDGPLVRVAVALLLLNGGPADAR